MRWYVAQTQPGREQCALLNLTRQDFTAYLPRWRKRRSHARKIDTVLAPLFPRYIFVSLDLDNMSWRSVNGTFGVSRMIANGERPAPVPRGVVEAIQSREGPDGAIKPRRSPAMPLWQGSAHCQRHTVTLLLPTITGRSVDRERSRQPTATRIR